MADHTPPQAPPAKMWDRLPGETDRAFAAFCTWLHSGARDQSAGATRRILEAAGVNYVVSRRWASQFRWKVRAAAFDAAREALTLKSAFAEAERLGREHMTILAKARRVAALNIQRALDEALAGEGPGAAIKFKDAAHVLHLCILDERLVIGEATSRTETAGAGQDFSALSPDELDQLRALVEKINGPGTGTDGK